MKRLLLVAVCLVWSVSADAQSACQLRTMGGNVWAATPSPSEPWGHLTFSDVADFLFDYPGVAGAVEITNVNAMLPYQIIGGVKSVLGSDGAWRPWEDDGAEFYGYIVNGSTGAYSEPFQLGPLHLKLTRAFDRWRTAVSVRRYTGVPAVLAHLSLTIRVCGNETQLRDEAAK